MSDADRILCKTHLRTVLGDRDGEGLLLLIEPSLERKAESLKRELELKIEIAPCERFPDKFWAIF